MATLDEETISILLVEDDDVDAEAVVRAFNRARISYSIVRARDGLEALSLMRQGANGMGVPNPYLVLLDLNLPRMSGLEMLAELRSDPNLQTTVVFVLSTSSDDEDRTAAYREHVAGYLVKSKLGANFSGLSDLIDRYWRVVELPPSTVYPAGGEAS